MKKNDPSTNSDRPDVPSAGQGLRQQAEEKLSQRKKSPETETDTLRLIHELEVHQIELEMQNEELLQTKAALEATLSLYAELYAFASVGYFTLTRDGTIRRANLTGATMLGVGLNELIKRRFALFVAPESRLTFSTFLDNVFTSGSKEICEVAVQKAESAPIWLQIEAIVDSSNGQDKLCYAIVDDITSRKANSNCR
jgi:PAS domain S-box-containing protein